jgi:HAD superfamily hydrolase (TIGR01509 family)
MTHHSFDAIIFDFDGTLIDTETADFAACQMLYEELGLTLSLERWAAEVVGVQDGYNILFDELVRQSKNGLTKAGLWQRIHQLWELTLQDMGLMSGVEHLLPTLRTAGYPLAIATASDRAWVNRWLGYFKLASYFQTIATGDDVRHNKPAPDVFLLAADRLGIRPDRCLVFEDSMAGACAAKSAGMTVIAVPSPVTQSLDFSQADRVIAGLEQVTPAWIETLAEVCP